CARFSGNYKRVFDSW
nr:immunoglobulin heavy chain junction region [Macaca mulatta]MOV35968.1 immunoglobulin heavy chain junction region [Macaca mulatta]MOV36004.1 immunoglobulin heavy chain junction region [Macaca mulatta]MOV36094.1 immunoglobulin heavy chain junction region [Macaca mulatta]MOV36095.1 immunoglobulin heavy chain junction region [Macaca mulatta]